MWSGIVISIIIFYYYFDIERLFELNMFGHRRNQGIVELVNKILRREVVRYEDVDEEGWFGEGRKGEVLGFAGYRSKYEEKEKEEEKEGNVVLEGVSQFIAVDDDDVSKGECKCRCKCNQCQYQCNQCQYQVHHINSINRNMICILLHNMIR